jgi:hypothetical protein
MVVPGFLEQEDLALLAIGFGFNGLQVVQTLNR